MKNQNKRSDEKPNVTELPFSRLHHLLDVRKRNVELGFRDDPIEQLEMVVEQIDRILDLMGEASDDPNNGPHYSFVANVRDEIQDIIDDEHAHDEADKKRGLDREIRVSEKVWRHLWENSNRNQIETNILANHIIEAGAGLSH
jgi:hypothetical protein